VLLRILPEGEAEFPESPGAVTVVNPCLSGGALEIFLEPRLPAPLLAVVGTTPIADAVSTLAAPLGFATEAVAAGQLLPEGSTAVIISSHGREETATIRSALDSGVGFIGLVASRRRGAAVLEEMALTADERARVHTPVGVDIGARTAEEIALSIMAAVVRAIRVEGLVPPFGAPAPQETEAIDPVCGMQVTIGPDTPHLRIGDEDHWFCSTGCRDRFRANLGG
jgi:xanthine dehydrogenase accessory factor